MSKASQGSVRFADSFLAEVAEIAKRLDAESIERAAALLATVRERGGRLFIIGVGGSAANASHAVNDFRKICGMEAYAPTDNVSELTARTNDEGWAGVFENWLKVSRLRAADALLVFSVGGGNLEQNVRPNLVAAVLYVMYFTDGVPRPPDGLRELVIYPDVPEALRRLKEAGYVLLVVTNQPDVARGVTTIEQVNEINATMRAQLPLDDFFICPHDN